MTSDKNKLLIKIAIHLLVWVFLLLCPYLLSNSESLDLIRLVKFTWIPMVFYIVIFYFNYIYLIKKYLFTGKALLFIAINLGLIFIIILLHLQIRDILNVIYPSKTPLRPIQLFIYKDIISMLIPVIFSIATKTTERWSKSETEKQGREKEILHSELQLLKYQLQPHFFFNSLNTIYALIEKSPDLAQETVHSLSKLMRYMLYDTDTQKVNLSDEVEFMKQYISMMKLRTSDKTKIHTDFSSLTTDYKIAPLLFISLIENAFKHGVSANYDSEIFFSLYTDKDTIRFSAENTNFPKTDKDKSGSGIGLINLRKRLELTYPGKYRFVTKAEGKMFRVILEITTG